MFGVYRCCSYALPPTSWLPIVAAHGYWRSLSGARNASHCDSVLAVSTWSPPETRSSAFGLAASDDVQRVLPAGLVLGHVAGRADLRVAEEQEVVVALEGLRREGVRRRPAALGADPVGVRGVLRQAGDRRVAVEAAAGGDVRGAGGGEAWRRRPGTSPSTSDGGRGELDAWAVSAEEYQVTMRWVSSAPTPRMMPVRVAGSAAMAGAAWRRRRGRRWRRGRGRRAARTSGAGRPGARVSR